MSLREKTVLVLGLGESGLSMAQWLSRCGARLRVADTREALSGLLELRAALPEADFVAGAFVPALLEGVDLVAVSPGLQPERDLGQILPAAQARGIALVGDIELFAQALTALRVQQNYCPKLLAITGTNGKTTVTRMTGLLCERAGLSVQVAGNISPSVLTVLMRALDQNALPQVWVLELSSFQLYWTNTLCADAATILNLSEDHLDWHGTMAAYAAAKARIFSARTVRILNRDDPALASLSTPEAVGFSTRTPEKAGDYGLLCERGVEWLVAAEPGEESPAKGRRKAEQPTSAPLIKRLMPADALKVHGRHNAANALAALALCAAIDLPLAALLHGLRDYTGEPHRVEHVATIAGVDYYDDSKGTNVGATVAAIAGLSGNTAPRLLLIAGGDGKGQDFSPLAAAVAGRVKTVFLIGRDAPALRVALSTAAVELVDCASLEAAVSAAAGHAQAGDAVLLSPACASWDMFRNYQHRAEVFVAAVREHALQCGEVMV